MLSIIGAMLMLAGAALIAVGLGFWGGLLIVAGVLILATYLE